MNKVILLIVVLAVIWAVPPLRTAVGTAALPVLEKLGPAADFVANPVREMSARNRLAHIGGVISSDVSENRRPPEPGDITAWIRSRMSGQTGLDPWGNGYWMKRRDGATIVGSNGADGTADTEDDIIVEVQL